MKVLLWPIEMIFVSTTAGKLTPIKFKLPTDKGEMIIKIDKIIKSQEENISGSNIITYVCQTSGNKSIYNNPVSIFCKRTLFNIRFFK